jgi:hypothetical protein
MGRNQREKDGEPGFTRNLERRGGAAFGTLSNSPAPRRTANVEHAAAAAVPRRRDCEPREHNEE